MRHVIVPPPVLVERKDIRSGPIERPGTNFPRFGVIFTTSLGTTPDQLKAEDLLGAQLENTDLRGKEDDRFFEILGGYYTQKSGQGKDAKVNITHIFGVATDAAQGFGLQPGNHMLGDDWEMADISSATESGRKQRKEYLDERHKGEEGWALIVNYKPKRRQYPFSGRPMEIVVECPELGTMTVHVGTLNDTTLEVKADVVVKSGEARGFIWDWGDGTTSTSIRPKATHTYARPEGIGKNYEIKVRVRRPAVCSAEEKGTVFVSPLCPEIAIDRLAVTNENSGHSRVDISLKLSKGKPLKYIWNWGDGTNPEETDEPQASHVYVRTFETDGKYTVVVSSQGPDDCGDQTEAVVQIPAPPCPALTRIEQLGDAEEVSKTEVKFQFEAHVENGPADSFLWDWGDGSAPEKTKENKASHTYKRPAGDTEVYGVKVACKGPKSCSDEANTQVEVPGLCATLHQPQITVKEITDTSVLVSAVIDYTGPKPDTFIWNWGDKSTKDETSEANAEHTYKRPAGDAETYKVLVNTKGPDSCTGKTEGSIEIPGVCPVITNLILEVQRSDGDELDLVVTAITHGPEPGQFEWDWHDGSPKEVTQGPTGLHTYKLTYGQAAIVKVSVSTSGPDSCKAESEGVLEVPAPPCPLISIKGVRQEPVADGMMEVSFELDVNGVAPKSFEWDFGDGHKESTSSASISHQYPIPIGDSKSYAVSVKSSGPGVCVWKDTLEVAIAGVCPVLSPIAVSIAEKQEKETEYKVDFSVEADPGSPASYMWDFGDGTDPLKTDQAKVSHTYSRSYGDAKTFKVTLNTTGPGSCKASGTTTLQVPGRCPSVGALTLTKDEPSRTEQVVHAKLELKGGQPDEFLWDWGDGTNIEKTKNPEASHTYKRLIGLNNLNIVSVEARGPDSCKAYVRQSVEIPAGVECPAISRIDHFISDENDTTVTFAFAPVLENGNPTSLSWNWGDGSAEETTDEPTIYHTYQKNKDGEKDYTVKLSIKGPEDCTANGELNIKVPAPPKPCPKLKDLRILSSRNLNATQTQVVVEATFEDGTPTDFEWRWLAGGEPLRTKSPKATIVLNRPEDKDINCDIRLTYLGPGDCRGEEKVTARVPQAEQGEPWFCKIIPFLTAFLGALLTGTLIVCYAAELMEPAQVEPGRSAWIIGITITSLFLFVVSIIAWGLHGKRLGCPMGMCGWLAVGWVSAIAGLIVAFFMLECFNWIPLAVVFFVLAAVLAFLWFKNCAVNTKAKTFFIFLAVSLIAAAIACLLIAGPILICC